MKKNKIIIIICILLLSVISIINIYNAKYLNILYKNYYIKQIIWTILGILIMIIISKLNIKNIFKLSYIFYIINIILLILVLIIGKEINGSKGWLNFKIISFQPSELQKLSLTLLLINTVLKKEDNKIIFLKLFIFTFIPSLLVFIEPDTGAVIFYIIIFLTILFCKKFSKKTYIYLFLSLFILSLSFVFIFKYHPYLLKKLLGKGFYYRINRILNYKESYQMDMALTNIFSVGLIRNGFNKILLYVPEGVTDFIFAFSIGNFGYILFFIIVVIYLIILLNLSYLIKPYNDKKTNYLIISFIDMFFANIFINILMNLGLIPIIGITLPFLSYGGSNMILYYLYISIIFNLTNKDI